jgi:pimeloyl-ACP methyl ester carboxylesterase
MDTVHLLGENGSVIGVLSRPHPGVVDREVAAVFLNSGLLHRVGPFRLYVLLARRLAKAGIAVLRIDQSGKGDSGRRHGLPFEQSVSKDFEDAADFLRQHLGIKRFIVLGLCSGADDALFLSSRYPEIAGAVLLEAFSLRTLRYYVRHYGPRFFRVDLWFAWARRFVSSLRSLTVRAGNASANEPDMGLIREFPGITEIRKRYESIVKRKGKLLCVFTSAARSYYNYKGQLCAWLHLPFANELITEIYLPTARHTYPLATHRERLMHEVCTWVCREFGSDHAPVEPGTGKVVPGARPDSLVGEAG